MMTFLQFLNESVKSDMVDFLDAVAQKSEDLRGLYNTHRKELPPAQKRAAVKKLGDILDMVNGSGSLEALHNVARELKALFSGLELGKFEDEMVSSMSDAPFTPEEHHKISLTRQLGKLRHAIKQKISDLWNKDPEHDEQRKGLDKVYVAKMGEPDMARKFTSIQKRYGPNRELHTTLTFPSGATRTPY